MEGGDDFDIFDDLDNEDFYDDVDCLVVFIEDRKL